MRFSPQQQTVLGWVRNPQVVQPCKRNALLVAVAGAGKSTVLVEAAKAIEEMAPARNGRPSVSVAIAVYNKPAQLDLAAKLAKAGVDKSAVRAGTFHSFGLSAVRRWAPDVQIDDKKMSQLAAAAKVPEDLEEFVLAAVSLAKQRAFGVLTKLDDLAAWYQMAQHYDLEEKLGEGSLNGDGDSRVATAFAYAIQLMRESLKASREVLDYDDMIYVPLAANLRVWQNNWVMVDEAQDTNPARRALAKRMLLPTGRFVAVGDPFQAIYGFTGADNDALDTLKREFDCVELPLTCTYRCPKEVVSFARNYVNHITAAPEAPLGQVSMMQPEEFALLDKSALDANSAVLCRNTAPLVQLAFQLLRRKIPCHIEGKDIGAGLAALATKWKAVKTVAALRNKLETYLEKETAKLMAKGGELKAANLADRVGSLYVVMESLPDDAPVKAVADAVREIFATTPDGAPSPNLTLATAHRSKGREWDRVYLLGRSAYMPSPYARQSWQQDQERNLIYVAITRAKCHLIDVAVSPNGSKR